MCLALTLANTFSPLLADPPVIHANTLVLHPDHRITFQFQADPGDTRIFQVERTPVLQAGGTWQTEPSASILEGAPGLFVVEFQQSPGEPAQYYRLIASSPPPPRLLITEVMSDNTTAYADSAGAYWDWIEIYNPNDSAVSLLDYGLSDDAAELQKWRFPEMLLQPGRYLMVFASGLDRRVVGADLHTNFKISSGGETLLLTGPDASLVDRVDVPSLGSNESLGRDPLQPANWVVYAQSLITPSQPNSAVSTGPPLPPPLFSTEDQFLPAGTRFSLDLATSTPGAVIRFTIDGSPVTASSAVWTSPLTLASHRVVRARCYLADRTSDEAMRSYFFGVAHDLPVISLAASPTNFTFKDGYLFGMGSAVLGANGQVLQNYPFTGSNAWKDREVEIGIEYFETNRMKFRQRVGLSVFGGWGSRGYPQKSVALFARQAYGSGAINHRIFPDRSINQFESLVLRNSGNDNQSTHQTAPRPPITPFGTTYTYGSYFVNGNFTMMRDAMEQRLLDGTSLDTQAYRPAVVYINGEYWGIYNVREKISEPYVLANHGFARGEVDVIEAYGSVMAGDATAYNAMRTFVSTKDLKVAANYNTVATQYLDIDNFIDYHLAVIYFQNFDIGNIKCWRPRIGDGRFRWIVYDQDYGFNLWKPEVYLAAMARDYADYSNMFKFYTAATGTGTGWPNEGGRTLLLRRMLLSDTFKSRFIQRCADLLNTHFREERVLTNIQAMASVIRPEMGSHLQRWSWSELSKRGYGAPYKSEYAPFTTNTWESHLTVLENFARARPAQLRQDCTNYFKLAKGFAQITVVVDPPGAGHVQLNTATVESFPWTGIYFRDYPVALAAIPHAGYRWVEWSTETLTTNTARWSLDLAATNLSLVARFEPAPVTYPESPSVYITELQYHPAATAESGDWIELWNASGTNVTTTGWILRDASEEHEFVLPASSIPAGGYLVLCQDQLRFRRLFPTVLNCVGSFSFGLNNAGDAIRLFDASGAGVVQLPYDDAAPWPTEPDGNGPTLQLVDPRTYSTNAAAWRASSASGGTPGRANP